MSEEITPGVVHTRYVTTGPNILDIITVDLTAPYLQFQSWRPDTLTRTTEQALANDQPGHRVVAAVNGDFFSFDTSRPIGNQMSAGEFVHGVPTDNRYHFAVDEQGHPFLDALSFRGHFSTADGTGFPVNRINNTAPHDNLTAFNSYFGDHTPETQDVMEIVLLPVDEFRKGSGYEHVMEIDRIYRSGDNPIPSDGFIIRAHTEEQITQLNNLITGQENVSLYLGFEPDLAGITEVIGGGVRILDQGEPYSGSNETRHPRTFVAINRDTTKIYLCTVDGRQLTSIGMSYREMADVLLQLGARDAVNLDGGGSTTMVIRNKVANSPSDPGGERKVANSLHLVSTAPPGEVEQLTILPERIELYPHETLQPELAAFDQYRNPVPVPEEIKWEIDPETGYLENGTFFPESKDTTGFLIARLGDIADTSRVRIHHFSALNSEPEELVLVPGDDALITLYGKTGAGEKREIPVGRARTDLTGEGLYLSDEGAVYTTGFGSGNLRFNVGDLTHVVPYRIEGKVTPGLLHDFSDMTGWMGPAQTHRAQITGVDPVASGMQGHNGMGVWTFVDDPEQDEDWDIRITRHLRQEIGNQIRDSHIATWVYLAEADEVPDAPPSAKLIPDEQAGNGIGAKDEKRTGNSKTGKSSKENSATENSAPGKSATASSASGISGTEGNAPGLPLHHEPDRDRADLFIQLVIRDGEGLLEAGPQTPLKTGQWLLIQTRLDNELFEAYLNGNGSLTRTGNQVNGFRITGNSEDLRNTSHTLYMHAILAAPFPIAEEKAAN